VKYFHWSTTRGYVTRHPDSAEYKPKPLNEEELRLATEPDPLDPVTHPEQRPPELRHLAPFEYASGVYEGQLSERADFSANDDDMDRQRIRHNRQRQDIEYELAMARHIPERGTLYVHDGDEYTQTFKNSSLYRKLMLDQVLGDRNRGLTTKELARRGIQRARH
jgi:hypothetical protein